MTTDAGDPAPRARRRGLAALGAVAAASSHRRSLTELLDVTVEAVHRAFASDVTSYLRVDRARGYLVHTVHRGMPEGPIESAREFPIDGGLSGQVIATGRAQLATDYGRDPRAVPDGRGGTLRGVISAPVEAAKEVKGVLVIASNTLVYDEDDLDIMAAIGRQLGAALEVADLLEALEASVERQRMLVETVPNVVYEMTPEGTPIYLSSKIEELVGWSHAQLAGNAARFEQLVHPEDRERRLAALRSLDRPDARVTTEYRLLHRNGRDICWVADHAAARLASHQEPAEAHAKPLLMITGALVDLRERKLVEAAGREQSRLASLGELAAGIAHEINNPLSGVINYAQLARRLLSREDQKLGEPLDGIIAEADRILEITRTLVSTARRPAREELRPLDPRELVKSSITLLKTQMKEDSIRLDVDVEEGLPPLRARGHELQQVLENLLTNARHALNARFPRWSPDKVLAIKVGRVEPPPLTEHVKIEVRDRGCGIAAENLPRIWDPFFTTRREGTGLGLSITRKIVQAHEGRIGVVSQPGEGTSFTVELPVWR